MQQTSSWDPVEQVRNHFAMQEKGQGRFMSKFSAYLIDVLVQPYDLTAGQRKHGNDAFCQYWQSCVVRDAQLHEPVEFNRQE